MTIRTTPDSMRLMNHPFLSVLNMFFSSVSSVQVMQNSPPFFIISQPLALMAATNWLHLVARWQGVVVIGVDDAFSLHVNIIISARVRFVAMPFSRYIKTLILLFFFFLLASFFLHLL
ncbi:hypothetical protein I7I53_05974 [Histoplasma capsulatum var. duboisii H88]|uniref:Transmembrane protein n=1 Tax=Ajellomyces capsulatus (strain H88) TaxID=544711 RepID=A0A8A1LFR6_AJEC8|nr:hypothetical protein I7I53_05974 [Histoplasma capsulatum var. duboisii H88]